MNNSENTFEKFKILKEKLYSDLNKDKKSIYDILVVYLACTENYKNIIKNLLTN